MVDRLSQYEQASPSLMDWKSAGMPTTRDMQQRANALMEQATRWIVNNPEIALTGAVVTGVVLGWLIKRR